MLKSRSNAREIGQLQLAGSILLPWQKPWLKPLEDMRGIGSLRDSQAGLQNPLQAKQCILRQSKAVVPPGLCREATCISLYSLTP